RPVGHLPPLRRGRDGHWRGDPKPVLSLPPFTGEAPPKGVKGALLILPCRPKIKIKSRPLPACRPPSPAARGKGQQLSRATGTRFRFPCEAGEAPPKGVKGALLILL